MAVYSIVISKEYNSLVQRIHDNKRSLQLIDSENNMSYDRRAYDKMGTLNIAFIILCATIHSANSNNISSENTNESSFSDCNGKVVRPGTIITSENYPEQYPNDQNCYIDIEFEVGQQVELTFLDFDVPGNANPFSSGCSTSGDYVKLIDGYIIVGNPYCQFNQPSSSVTSMAETLTINFKTKYNSNEYQGRGLN